jgi:N-acetylmuramoyl-L-alanine amidase
MAGAVAGLGIATWAVVTRRSGPAVAHDRRPHAPTRAAGRPSSGRDHGAGALTGFVVGIDPGHNGDNWANSSYIDQSVWNGREEEACDTTGTETAAGYTEAQFAFNVSQLLAASLRGQGAEVVLTRANNTGYGPCITQRASIVNDAGAHVAVSIHADGGPVDGRGFSILEPVASGTNDAVIGSSQTLGVCVREAFLSTTSMPVSDYYGVDGIVPRDDLGGLNLTTVPKVMVECGNMQNAADAALLADPQFQQQAATALARAITSFLVAEPTGPASASGSASI